MISQQRSMEVELDLDRIGLEMIELLGGLKPQSADQLDQKFFQEDKKTQEKSMKGETSRSKNKNNDTLQRNKNQSQKLFNKHFLQTIQNLKIFKTTRSWLMSIHSYFQIWIH